MLTVSHLTQHTYPHPCSCRVWAEPSVVQAAEHEFAQTEEFLQAAESVAGCDYVWTRYDILCLPPSFPYGGVRLHSCLCVSLLCARECARKTEERRQ